jgi:hypothetical protein
VGVAVIVVVGLLIVGAHSTRVPVPAERAIQERHSQEVLVQDAEEEARQAQYAATPAAPQPTGGWQP